MKTRLIPEPGDHVVLKDGRRGVVVEQGETLETQWFKFRPDGEPEGAAAPASTTDIECYVDHSHPRMSPSQPEAT